MKESDIRMYLSEENSQIKIISVKETTSTNDELKKIALSGEKDSVLFVSEAQTAGRGRKGRSFFSPKNTGIYMSLLIHPRLSPEECTLITPLCAVAVAEAIEKVTDIKADIKWVNDVYSDGKKVAGILTEGAFTPKGADYVIVGIGINLARPEKGFPEEIRHIAGSLTESCEGLRERLIAETVNRFMYHLSRIKIKDFISLYRERLFFLGEEITVISAKGIYKATALDIDSSCRLTVKNEKEEILTLGSGEISIKP